MLLLKDVKKHGLLFKIQEMEVLHDDSASVCLQEIVLDAGVYLALPGLKVMFAYDTGTSGLDRYVRLLGTDTL